MPVKCRDIFKIIEEMAPRRLAESWDNTGLQVGDPRAEVDRVLLALDVNLLVAEEAKKKGAGLILSHHPLLLKPPKSISLDRPEGELIGYLIRNNITVYAAHTNLDSADGGVNTVLAEKLGLTGLSVLHHTGRERYLKLSVFVPAGHVEDVRNAVSEAGAGWIGNYSHCTFVTPGTGTFKPLEGTSPFIGEAGAVAKVEEYRLETIVPAGRLEKVIGAMLAAHPYEEVAYDLYPLENPGPAHGPGRVGTLPEPMLFQQFAERVKEALILPAVRLGGSPGSIVRRVAVCGGSGAELWPDALRAGADTLVTGDVKYHTAQNMLAAGLKFVDAGHHGTEAVVLPALRRYLADRCTAAGLAVEFVLSQTNTDPFAYL
ncbi:MAG: Nif3-like dinuclear metal center hexameric protein [Peptococcaceae bacterium]|nr:Nif3-like dinuclear metal center hexameric protein [Peptococcaceae bacterium]